MKFNLKAVLAVLGISAAIVAAVLFSGGELSEKDRQKELVTGKFIAGTTVNGMNIGGLRYNEAKEKLKEEENKLLKKINVTAYAGENKMTFTAEDFKVSFDTEAVLEELMLEGKEGRLIDRIKNKRSPRNITMKIEGFKEPEKIRTAAAELSNDAVNAQMQFTPGGKSSFSYTREKEGVYVDPEAFLNTALKAAEEGKNTANIEIKKTEPEVTEEQLKNSVVLRSYFETSYAEAPYNDENRVYNIKKCVNIINSNKITLQPGESLSLNAILGDRTEKNGWKLAPGYISGRSEDQPGGGVCQISSTLYCAALKADLTATQRKNHSIPVGYINMGLDATISTGGPDLVIKNTTGAPIYICCGLTGKSSVYFMVYGAPLEGFTKILLKSEKLRDIEPEGDMVYTYTNELPAGEEKVRVKRRTGSEYRAYKCYYNGQSVIKTADIASSLYSAFAGETLVGVNAALSLSS